MAVCAACGTENREKAKFCRGCAASLAQASDAPAVSTSVKTPGPTASVEPTKPAPTQVCAACQASNSLAATACKSCGASLILYAPLVGDGVGKTGARLGPVLLGLLFVAVVAGGWWWGSARSVAERPSAAAPALRESPAVLQTQVATTIPTASATALPASAGANETQRQTRERQLREERKERLEQQRVAKAERARAALALQQQQAEEARQRTEQAQRQAAQTQAAEKPSKKPVQPEAPTQTVAQLCDGNGNVFSRDFCRIRECRKPALAGDPICVSYRAMEKAQRNEFGG
ncbi:zinc ribbon domain-containing protein [Hydrogenophaga sp.]|uniref:double zinc ribbon domain-containing protein n=1 Tax=Hydrogenophaga sp. TaxID=1904254 RepID=UPI003563AFBE